MKAFKFLLGFLAVVQVASAKVIYVDDDASAGGDGSSWSSAHKYLQDALDGAQSGDEVWVAEGTYKPDQGSGVTAGDRTASFTLDGISLYGGFVGSETTNTPAGLHEKTILSGEIDSNSTFWSLHVVTTIGSPVSLNGVTVMKGNANGSEDYSQGGGVFCSGLGTFTNCVFTNNSAKRGGGVYGPNGTFTNCTFTNNSAVTGAGVYGSNGTFTNCTFTNNSASLRGGGVYGSNGTLTNCTFTNNSASDDMGGGVYSHVGSTLANCVFTNNSAKRGGGVSGFDGTSTLTNCTFTNNLASDMGGGVYARGDPSTLINCVFKNNSAKRGGGVYSSKGTFTNCTFTNNSAATGAGVYGKGTFTNCTFTNNSASDDGGGVYGHAGTSTLINCVFTNNSAKRGGGVYSSIGTFTNCTFTNNSAVTGAGVYGFNRTFTNCILWKNYSNEVEGHGFSGSLEPIKTTEQEAIAEQYPGDANAQEAIYSYKYYKNIFQGWTGNENAFSADPLFANIDDPIGPDGIWFTADDGLRLRSSSPAIDAGIDSDLSTDSADLDNDNNTTEHIPSDIAGYRRIQGSAVDLGAYEYGYELMPTAPQYSISAIASTDGTVSGGGTFDEDASVTLTATPSNSGYIFSGWSGDASGTTNPLTITADSDKTITANFSKDDGDDDDDGISNYDEIVTYETSKSSNDTDGDGLTDKEEIERGLNPKSSDKATIDAVMELKAIRADNVTPLVTGWYYVPNHGWFWTNKDAYPYTYSAEDKDWMYFQSGEEKPRFYRYKTKAWLTIE